MMDTTTNAPVFHDIPKMKINFISVNKFFPVKEGMLCHDGKHRACLIFNLFQKPISKIQSVKGEILLR
jgi:hypothetical protein